jgi:phenol 2-monooxygenase (NADPH)
MLPKQADVVICGSGTAGLCTGLWLARYGIQCTILEQNPGPMKIGRADGVQCRTVEIFESFGIGEELLRESHHILEATFWSTNESGDLRRTGRTIDTIRGLTHVPHVILTQARINGLMVGLMRRLNDQEIEYGSTVKGVSIDEGLAEDTSAYPVKVHVEKGYSTEIIEAKYVLVGTTF